MNIKLLFFINILIGLVFSHALQASGEITEQEIQGVSKVAIMTDEDKARLSITAGILANYEIESKKLIKMVERASGMNDAIQTQSGKLLTLSENVIDSARFRLPQCDEYLARSLDLKDRLDSISHATLEQDFHLDGALPKAPAECYHTKDLFVHPATVIVLTRDDPGLSPETKESIKAEITEVLAHTEIVRQLVIY